VENRTNKEAQTTLPITRTNEIS